MIACSNRISYSSKKTCQHMQFFSNTDKYTYDCTIQHAHLNAHTAQSVITTVIRTLCHRCHNHHQHYHSNANVVVCSSIEFCMHVFDCISIY